MTADEVLAALADVEDPELPIGIVDLGLVRSVAIDGGAVTVGITFTSIACPCHDLIREDIEARLRRLDEVTSVEVEDLFEPWSRDDVTEAGRIALRAIGVA